MDLVSILIALVTFITLRVIAGTVFLYRNDNKPKETSSPSKHPYEKVISETVKKVSEEIEKTLEEGKDSLKISYLDWSTEYSEDVDKIIANTLADIFKKKYQIQLEFAYTTSSYFPVNCKIKLN